MECLSRWRYWIRPLVISVYFVLVTIGLPLMVWEFAKNHVQIHLQAWFVGGLFVIMAVPISLWGILQHLVNYTKPFLQRHIIRILWMVPIYALNAWFALRFKAANIYLDTLRECYEAYVIYNFMTYLMAFLRSEHPNLEDVIASKRQVKHLVPFCFLPQWIMGSQLIHRCRHGVLQYTVVRPVTTIIALICQWAGKYGEGDFSFKSAWSYLVIVNNISQIWAMYCLVLFYFATKEELAPLKPVSKFMCVKAVVFLSFWQSLVIAGLAKLNVIKDTEDWFKGEIANGLQDFLICIEMFFAAIAHYFSFSHIPYVDPEIGTGNCCTSFMSMWDVSDVRDDVVDHVRHVGKTVVRPMRSNVQSGERAPLLANQESRDTEGGSQQATALICLNDMSYDSPYHETRTKLRAQNEDTSSVHTLESSTSTTVTVDNYGDHHSLTASMNNYAQFTDSLTTSPEDTPTRSVSSARETPTRDSQSTAAPSASRALHALPENVLVDISDASTVKSTVSEKPAEVAPSEDLSQLLKAGSSDTGNLLVDISDTKSIKADSDTAASVKTDGSENKR